ncbi:MAG: YigZ family protein [Bacteroidales bacterium]|nr:YigZ family protein [Candidatus Cacconaster merdequi]
MTTSDTYKSIASASQGVYKDLGSKFLAFAYPVESTDEVKGIVERIKKEYFDARHHCYAYRIGKDGQQWRVNDDGEPSSTAGRPILGQILSNGLSDILVVVVRYFGGTKLGVPGLIKAYRSATADAIAGSRIIEKVAGVVYSIDFDYLQMNDVQKILKDMGITPLHQSFDLSCHIEARVRLSLEEEFCKALSFCRIKSLSLHSS